MTSEPHPKDDPRTVEELINAALTEMDEEVAWDAICTLRWRGTRQILQRAEMLCMSQCPHERRVGADILGQLGVPERTFPTESSSVLRSLVRHSETPEVLQAALVGLSFHYDSRTVPLACRFATHPDPGVRHAVVGALSGVEDPRALECLIALSKDADAHVRDWATFALGTLSEVDTPEIRDALADRLSDPDFDTRGEALVGLASRKDQRVIGALKHELRAGEIGVLAIEAAELIASPELYAHLIALREWWDVDAELLERAISASHS